MTACLLQLLNMFSDVANAESQQLCCLRLDQLLQLETLLAQCLEAHPAFRPLAAHAQFFEQASALKSREKKPKKAKAKSKAAKASMKLFWINRRPQAGHVPGSLCLALTLHGSIGKGG